jgi:arylsulfatase
MPTTGTLSLFVGDEKVGEGQIMTQPGNFSLVGEGLNVGRDPAEPVTDDYPGSSPFAFTAGRSRRPWSTSRASTTSISSWKRSR